MSQIKGSIVALVTPFHEDGSVNYEKLDEMLEWHIAEGTDGILVLGTTGESTTMSHEEDDAVAKFAIDHVAHRVPVIVGTGSNSTQTALEKSLRAADMGADLLLTISPYYNKANKEGMYHHFADVADKTKCPIIVYNVPGRTGCSVSEDVMARLAKHPNVYGVKEASGNISYLTNIATLVDDNFHLYSGNDDMITSTLSLGGSGVISVLANVAPKDTHNMVMEWFNGNPKGSLDLQLKYLDLIRSLFCEVNPIPVKEALNLMGMDVGPFRMPLYPMDPKNRARLEKSLKDVGLL
ncbi:MAG: 4-hydroxy-tetrahydrodipicolinate synthase [Faecalicoccus sp.]|nr:4-hydroxy-tetrahydrodipicolinate synthase [Faecalicoccus sp.]